MDSLQHHWNTSTNSIPQDKDPSIYAVEKEKTFPKNAVVCDLGGGSGADSLYFASCGHNVRLIDISDTGLRIAMDAASVHRLSHLIKTFQCNLNDAILPLPNASCDILYSRLALHYFESKTLTELFKEIYRVLKPTGTAYLTLKSPDDKEEMDYLKKTAVVKEAGVFNEDGHIKTRFTLAQLAHMLEAAKIDDKEFDIGFYTEILSGRKDRVKSGNSKMLLSEIKIHKTAVIRPGQ